jgi:hypothetical protein
MFNKLLTFLNTLYVLIAVSFTACTQHSDTIRIKSVKDTLVEHSFYSEMAQFKSEGWDTLAQPQFWHKIMHMSKDSCIVNVAETRQILAKIPLSSWDKKTTLLQANYKDSLRVEFDLLPTATIFITSGKSDFYQFGSSLENIERSTLVFEADSVDPWYAQAILMIESPGSLKKSNVGAYGPFQLMPGVARQMGLTVSKKIDERENLEKSAHGAAKLISTTCIPYAKRMLDAKGIEYDERSTWFRLFVLHVYHAGAGNVNKVLNAIDPEIGGQSLITSMWHTKVGAFGNSSQNYSQLALAAQFILHQMVESSPTFLRSSNLKG